MDILDGAKKTLLPNQQVQQHKKTISCTRVNRVIQVKSVEIILSPTNGVPLQEW